MVIQQIPHEGFDVFGAINQTWQELCSHYSNQGLAVIFTFIEAMHQMNRGTVAHYRKDDAHKQTEV